VVDHANPLRCRSGSDLRTGVANRGTKRTERNKKKERRSLAEKISVYGRRVHQRYPTGDVVVRERDLGERLRKHPDAVVTALNLLLNEQKFKRLL